MTLKLRFTLFFVFLVTLLTSLFSVLVYQQIQSHLISQAERNLARFLEHEVEHWESLGVHQQDSLAKGIYFSVEKNGEIVFDSLPKSNKEALHRSITRQIGNDKYLYTAHHGMSEIRSYLAALQTFFLGAGTLILLLTGPFAYLSARMLLMPFRRLAIATREFTAESLSRRLSIPGSRDEYSLLVRSFNNLFERLQGSFDELQRYAQNVSHEFRTPVSIISAQAENALKKEREPEVGRTALEKILTQARKLDRMAAHLLALGDIRLWARKDNLKPVNVLTTTEELVQSIQRKPWASDKSYSIEATSPDTPKIVSTNEELFVTVVGNLLENAFYFSRTFVAIEIGLLDGQLEITVRDDGPGITADKRQQVFQPFFTERPGGHGLGLTIVKAALDAARGKIELLAAPTGGLMARAVFPLGK